MKKKLMAVALVMACVAVLSTVYFVRDSHQSHHHGLGALAQTLLPVEAGAPVAFAPLLAADGAPFGPERLKGRWSLVFFGFTSCPDVCPTTLQLLSEVARHAASGVPHAASGVPSGATQIVFVTVDPQRDTPAHLKAYLAHFDERIVGLTGSREHLDRFAAGLGAASAPSGSGGFDHSTSLFAVDPQGRLAGIMLRPADPARIVADLTLLRTSAAGGAHASRAR